MHIHYLALKQLTEWLKPRIIGFTMVEAFSQQKDELVFGLAGPAEDLYLRVACSGPLPHIWPVENFRKAKKNVVELFLPLVGKDVVSVRNVPWERVMIIGFEEGYEVVLKMHGVQSNVLLRKDNHIEEIFRQQKAEDLSFQETGGSLNWEALSAPPTDPPLSIAQRIRQVSPTLDKNFAERLTDTDPSAEVLETQLRALIQEAENDTFHIRRKGDKMQFLLIDPKQEGAVAKQGIFEGFNFFFRNYFLLRHYTQIHGETARLIAKPLKKAKGQEGSYWRNLEKLENKRSDEEIGHLIMANLHNIPPRAEKVTLEDFYNDGATVDIKLKPELSPQKNAEVFYQKQKKRKTKNKYLEDLIEGLQGTIAKYEKLQAEFAEFPAVKAFEFTPTGFEYKWVKGLQKFRKQNEKLLQSGQKKQQEAQQRFMEFEKDGYRIYVGRNSKNNDELSLHFAKKEDMWLHAKDVAGSHVVIRNPGGKPVPTPVLEYAASLAAYFSKRKGEELVPVTYTPKKYIRKTRHLAAGEVIVEREEVVLIEPRPFD